MNRHHTASQTVLWLCLFALLVMTCLPSGTHAQDGAHGGDNAGSKPTSTFKPGSAVSAPRTTERFTEKGMTLNPIAIDFDPHGNLYIAEGWRAGIAVIDNRNAGLRRSNGVINDLQKTSVEDRLKQIEMLEEGGFYPKGIFNREADKVRFLADTDGDGKADKSTIFADGFNDKLDGIASGVLWHDGKVYLTNIPHLWLLEDKDGDGDADKETEGERVSLSYGYGIRWAFYGHDMHGLIKGPDGRIYFSIGDRGYNVTNKEGKQLYGPDRGAVFRMWPDGSELEVFYEGLRNPQELAFDNYGNLFTGDNNCDAGDLARFIYLPEGGHSGWNQDVQSLPHRGPWHREHLWKPRFAKDDPAQAAWIIPPVANVGRGPSGLAHYPGTGDAFPKNGSFLLCDYPAGVRHVYVEPDGAGFKVVEDTRLPAEGDTITDVAWGYDGRLYLSDWGGGWKPNPNGYVKTMVNKAAHQEQAKLIAEVKSLFANGFTEMDEEKLLDLLGHADQRVRLAAQYEATKRASVDGLLDRLTDLQDNELERLHAMWALGMRARSDARLALLIETRLEDPNDQVRGQALKLLGELGKTDLDKFIKCLKDKSPIVQHHAAIAMGKTGREDAILPLLDLLERNNDDDVIIRHAASYALSLIGNGDEIMHYAMQREASAPRLGAVLALRRLESPELIMFLDDNDPVVAAEAARAVYDKRVMDAMPKLAELADKLRKEMMIEPIMRRVIEANVRLADRDSATRLARLAANPEVPEPWRELALNELDNWSAERNREGVWGSWWPRPEQTMESARLALITLMPTILENAQGKVKDLARTLEQKHVANAPPEVLAKLALSPDEPAELRLVAAKKLANSDSAKAIEVTTAMSAGDAVPVELRISARALLTTLNKPAGVASYLSAYASDNLQERQDAVRGLAKQDHPDAIAKITALANELRQGKLSPELRLDVLEALTGNPGLPVEARAVASQYKQQHQAPGDEPYIRDAVLSGGSIQAGRDIFYNHPGATCTQCHRMDNQPAQGPNLSAIGAIHDVNYLYTAIVNPSADIAEGYATTAVKLKDGTVLSGRVLRDKSTPAKIVLINSEGKETEIQRQNIEGRPVTSDQSMMKKMNDQLSPGELRDLLAYLGSLKGDGSGQAGTSSAAKDDGPYILSPAKDWSHAILLPAVLMGIFISLGLLLLVTVLGGGRVA